MITPESSNQFPWISIWQLVEPHANYCVDILKARWLRPTFAELYRLLRMTLSKEVLAVHVWNAPNQWHNWRVAGVRTASPCQAKCKNRDPTCLYIGICYSFGFSKLLFFAFFGVFSGDFFGFCIAVKYRICYCFSTIFWVLASGFPSAKFPLAQTSSYVTAPDQSKVVLQIRVMCRASSNILQ